MSRTHKHGGHEASKHLEIKNTNKYQRTAAREFISNCKKNEDYFSNESIENWSDGLESNVYCYWKPIYRWLAANVNRPWDQVYSELKIKLTEMFGEDQASQRIKSAVEINEDPRFPRTEVHFYRNYFYVENGILKKAQHKKREKFSFPKKVPFKIEKLLSWLDGRVAGEYEGKMFWHKEYVGTKKHGRSGDHHKFKCEFVPPGRLQYVYWGTFVTRDNLGNQVKKESRLAIYHPNTRRDIEFSKDDYEFWAKLPPYYQNEVLKFSSMKKDDYWRIRMGYRIW